MQERRAGSSGPTAGKWATMVFLIIGFAVVSLAFATFTGTTWLMRLQKQNNQTIAGSRPIADVQVLRGGKGRLMD